MKEFIITNTRNSACDFCFKVLENGSFLYYEEHLNIEIARGKKSGKEYCLLGYAIQTDENQTDPIRVLEEEAFSNLEEAFYTWCGRWALIVDGKIYNDALCMMKLNYSQEGDFFGISNSVKILNDFRRALSINVSYRDLYPENKVEFDKGEIIDYYPGPGTIFKDVYSVMYGQYIVIEDNRMSLRELGIFKSKENYYKDYSLSELVSMMNNHFLTFFKNLPSRFNTVMVALSGGYDSRTLFSCALKAGIKFSCYTCDKATITQSDKLIPPKICKRFHIEHTYRKKTSLQAEEISERAEIFDDFVSNLAINRDREYYIYSQIPNIKNSVVLGGVGMELIQSYKYYEIYRWIDCNTHNINNLPATGHITPLIDTQLSISNPLIKELFGEYLKHLENDKHKHGNITFIDRVHIDQRLGCWCARTEQAWDILDSTRLEPIDCQCIIDIANEIRSREKLCMDDTLQRELIGMNEPKLLKYKFNYEPILFRERIRKTVKRLIPRKIRKAMKKVMWF